MPRSRSTASRATRQRPASLPSVVRIAEAVGSSTTSWDAAVVEAVRGAKDDAPAPIAVEVVRLWADLGARRSLGRYHAAVKIAYRQSVVPPAPERPRRTARGSGRSGSR
jgi:flavin-binding protein dodecin